MTTGGTFIVGDPPTLIVVDGTPERGMSGGVKPLGGIKSTGGVNVAGGAGGGCIVDTGTVGGVGGTNPGGFTTGGVDGVFIIIGGLSTGGGVTGGVNTDGAGYDGPDSDAGGWAISPSGGT